MMTSTRNKNYGKKKKNHKHIYLAERFHEFDARKIKNEKQCPLPLPLSLSLTLSLFYSALVSYSLISSFRFLLPPVTFALIAATVI